MTEHIDNRTVNHHVRAMSPPVARMDRLPCRDAARAMRAHTRFGGSARSRSQEVSKGPPLMPEMPETPNALPPVAETVKCGRIAGGATVWSHPTVAFTGRFSMSRVSPSERQDTAPTGGPKHCQVRWLTPETGDSDRHRSEVRKMSRIASLATTSSQDKAPGMVTGCGEEIAGIALIGKSLENRHRTVVHVCRRKSLKSRKLVATMQGPLPWRQRLRVQAFAPSPARSPPWPPGPGALPASNAAACASGHER
jgi:hypothetical protein